MGKKRVVKKSGSGFDPGLKSRVLARASKKKVTEGVIYIQSTYNNTRVLLTDKNGNAITNTSSGALGFKGAKKGTPYAAAKVGEVVGEQAITIGVKSVDVIIKGVGAGRESSLRALSNKGIQIISIKDVTPIPFNGPKPRKKRRV